MPSEFQRKLTDEEKEAVASQAANTLSMLEQAIPESNWNDAQKKEAEHLRELIGAGNDADSERRYARRRSQVEKPTEREVENPPSDEQS